MPAALWLVGLPVGAATIVFLFRRSWIGAALAVLIAGLMTWLVVQLSSGVAFNLLGRTIELDRLSKATLFLLFASTALLFFILALRSSITYAETIRREGRFFYPAALIILSLFAAANLSRHLGITAIFVELAAILMVFVIQTERLESTRASLRFLILISLATPLFLLAAWQIDSFQLSGGIILPANIERVALLVGVGFAVWLAVFPFHGWLISTAAESSPPTAAFVLITFPTVGFATLMHLFIDLPWLVDSEYLVTAIIIAGVFTAFVAGVLASVQRGYSQLMGYTALFDLGCMVAVLGLGGGAVVITILVSLAVRALALVLIAVSLLIYHVQVHSLGFAQIRGLAYKMPIATVGLLTGGLTLAGAPFTAGFTLRWQLFQTITPFSLLVTLLLVLASIGVSIGYLRGFRAALATDAAPGRGRREVDEPLSLVIVTLLLTSACILLGVFPWLLIEPLQTVSVYILFPIK